MATIVTRETTQTDGTSPKGSPLTNAEVDTNFINLNDDKVEVSGAIIFQAKAGEALAKGDVVYVSGVSGNEPIVSKADADDASKMPAYGLAEDAANLNAAVNVVTFGTLYDLNTSGFSAGDTVYVSTTAGALTNSAPTGESSLIQNIGMVVRSHASAGSIKVGGAGRTNATPNLNDGNVFIGNASNQAAARALTTADIASGTFADARIAQSNVTQHQAALSITESQISDLQAYLTAESDTLDSVTGRGATTTNAVTVGNLTSTGIDDNAVSTAITIDSSQDVTFTSDAKFPDNGKAIFGAGSDLQIYHDGSNSVIQDSGTGDLEVQANRFVVQSASGADDFLIVTPSAGVDLRHNVSGTVGTKLATTSTGIDVTGTVTSDKAIVGYSRAAGTGGIVLYDDDQAENRLTLLTGGGTGINAVINQAGGSLNITDASLNAVATFNDGGNVGIGTTSPSSTLHLYGTGTPIRLNIEATTGRVESRLDNTSGAFIFGIDDSGGAGFGSAYSRNIYSNGAYPMLFWTNNTERMRIDSSGRVFIGKTSDNDNTAGHTLHSSGLAVHTRNSSFAAIFNRTTNDGDIAQFKKDGALVGSIGNDSTALTIGSGSTGIKFGTAAVWATTGGSTNSNGAKDLGASTVRWKDLYLSNSISLSNASTSAFLQVSTNILQFGASSSDPVAFYVNNTERMRITSSGNVGIGTASPSTSLDVVRAGAMPLRVQSTSGTECQINMVNTGGNVQLEAHSGNFNIDADNVGIGTTSPDQTLHVHKGSAGTVASQANSVLTLENSTTAVLQFLSPNTASNQIRFGDPQDNGAGYIDYSHSSSALTFGVNGPERMRIDSSGRVGIGITPSYTLDIQAIASSFNPVRFSGHGSSIDAFLYTDTAYWSIGDAAAYGGNLWGGNKTSNFVHAYTNGSERMRIDSSGNVIAGGTSAQAANAVTLMSDGEVTAAGFYFSNNIGSAMNDTGIRRATTSTMVFDTGSTERMRIDSSGRLLVNATNATSGGFNPSALIKQTYDGGFAVGFNLEGATADTVFGIGYNSANGAWELGPSYRSTAGYKPIAFATSGAEKMRLDTSGNLLVGTNSLSADERLSVKKATNGGVGVAYFENTNNANGDQGIRTVLGANADNTTSYHYVGRTGTNDRIYIFGSGNIVNANNSYGALSDERLKSNIVDASSQIDDIMAVQVRRYTLKETGETQIGVVAQELEASGMSGLVQENEKGIKSVKYSILYLKAIKALQEAVTRIETLEAEVAALKGA